MKRKISAVFVSLVLAVGLFAQVKPDVSQTTLTFAQQSILASSTAQVANLNADAQKRCDMAVTDYNANMQSGVSAVNPRVPVCDLKWQLAPPDANGFVFYQYGPDRIVSSIPLATVNNGAIKPTPRDPNHICVGNRISGPWWQVCAGDGTPNGFITPPNTVSTDGVTGSFVKFGAPVGAGWYQKQ